MTAELLARSLGGERRVGAEWRAYCPVHEVDGGPHGPSLSISEKKGLVVWTCRAGCDKNAVTAALRERGLLDGNGYGATRPEWRRVQHRLEKPSREIGRTKWVIRDIDGNRVTEHHRVDYVDDNGKRSEEYSFSGGLGGKSPASLPFFGMEQLKGLADGATVVVAEGEKASDALREAGFIAVGTVTGAKKNQGDVHCDAVLQHLIRFRIVLWPDNDAVGRAHMQRHAKRLLALGASVVLVVNWPDAPEGCNAADYDKDDERLVALIEAAKPFEPKPEVAKPWDRAKPLAHLLDESGDDNLVWVVEKILAPAAVTFIVSPRSVGKTFVAHAMAVALASKGKALFAGRPVRSGRVLLLDRDNPRREVKRRLRKWSAELDPGQLELDVMFREDVPSLTNAEAWAALPAAGYNAVILDSWGSSTEGVDETAGGDSGKAIAPLLDLAHAADTAVLVLANTDKMGVKIRGSGVIPDRVELVLEVRDLTGVNWDPKRESWIDCLPSSGEESWLDKSRRRKRRECYRLAFVPSKFRLDIEPEPFVLEIRLPEAEPWSLHDVTAEVEQEFAAAQRSIEASLLKKRETAVDKLRQRIEGGAPISKTHAADFLKEVGGLKRAEARAEIEQAVQSGLFTIERDETSVPGRGAKPGILRLPNSERTRSPNEEI